MYEKMQVFVMADELRRLTGLPRDIAHEQIVRITDMEESRDVAQKISDLLPELEVYDLAEASARPGNDV